MQEVNEQQKKPFKMKDLSFDERARLVGSFAWLINEDKKQNPALDIYQIKKTESYD